MICKLSIAIVITLTRYFRKTSSLTKISVPIHHCLNSILLEHQGLPTHLTLHFQRAQEPARRTVYFMTFIKHQTPRSFSCWVTYIITILLLIPSIYLNKLTIRCSPAKFSLTFISRCQSSIFTMTMISALMMLTEIQNLGMRLLLPTIIMCRTMIFIPMTY